MRAETIKNVFVICLLQMLLFSFAFAQKQPFSDLDKQVEETNWSEFAVLSKVFNDERIRLGQSFETELWKYLSDETVNKHYSVSLFLDTKAYLHGNKPLAELALAIRQKALKILAGKNDVVSLVQKQSLLVTSSIAAEKLSKKGLALEYKKQLDDFWLINPDLKKYFPILSEYNLCIYKNIGGDTNQCRESDASIQVEEGQTSIKSVVNAKATALPQPPFPSKARKNGILGTVKVQVTIDEQGKVVSAKAIEGPIELQDAAVKAALKATFTPTTLYGRPVKSTGIVFYNFNP